MRLDDRIRLRHLREAATKAIRYSEGRQRGDLDVLWQTITEDLPQLLSLLPEEHEAPDDR